MMTKSKHRKEKPDKAGGEQKPLKIGEGSLNTLEVSEEVASLIEKIECERDEAIEGRKRALADFANFQKRARDNEKRAYGEGGVQTVRTLLPMMDHFDLALNQDASQVSGEQFAEGMILVRQELTKALESCGVRRIAPQVGEEFDPNVHEAVMRMEREGVLPNHIAQTMQAGYGLGDTVLRPAKVAVTPLPPEVDPGEGVEIGDERSTGERADRQDSDALES